MTSEANIPEGATGSVQEQQEQAVENSNITDLALCVHDQDKSFCFPGPMEIPGVLRDYCAALLTRCEEMRRLEPEREDFTVSHRDISWRVHVDDRAVDGQWLRARRMPKQAPHLGEGGLPSRLPPSMVNVLLHPELRRGGLIMIMGGAGCGKTHTAAAIVRSRLEHFGGIAYTVEDPPEHPLHGWHEGPNKVRGYCTQTLVASGVRTPDGWAASMNGALRSQPAGTPCILFVGEIRSNMAADVAIQAAGNGFLVIVTSFATDIPSGVADLIKRVGVERAGVISRLLRVVLYQRLVDGMLSAKICVSPNANSRMAAMMMGGLGQLARLDEEVQRQANYVRTDADLWRATVPEGS